MSNPVDKDSDSENRKTSEKVKKEKAIMCNQKTREGLCALSRVDLPNTIKHLGRATESWISYYFEYEKDLFQMKISVGTQFPEVKESDIEINEKNVSRVVMEVSSNFSMRARDSQLYTIIEGSIRTLEVESIKLLTVILSGAQSACESDELTSDQRQRMVKLCQVGLLTERYNEALKIYCRIINLLVLHLHPIDGAASWSDEAERKLQEWMEEVQEPWDFIVKELTKKNSLNQSKRWFSKIKEHMNVLLVELKTFKMSTNTIPETKRNIKN